MTFLWPEMLWLLAAVPALVALYVWLLRRKARVALRYASLELAKAAMGAGRRFRRHLPPLLFLGALGALLVAAARPATVITLPAHHETVILAMDVSGSMEANDVQPTRLAAAQAAARAFIADTPPSTRIGVVSFAGSAALVQAPTRSRADALAAIDRLALDHATAIGSGIVASLRAIFPDEPLEPYALPQVPAAPAAPGSHASAAIVLLTDGQSTAGPDPVEVARFAAARGVRIFTVGIGTPDGEILNREGWSVRVRLDEEPLRVIAELTRGEYYFAGNALDLKKVYRSLSGKLVLEKAHAEITALFSAAAAALALAAATLSLLWFHRLL